MNLEERVQNEIQEMIRNIKDHQCADGTWRYSFESGPMTDAYMIIILRTLESKDEELIKKLVSRLLNTQHSNGAWKLYDDDIGNLSATAEAYTALLFSGYVKKSDENMKKAEVFILENGGLESTHVSTKFMLALNSLYPWPIYFPLPLLIMNIPVFFPLNFYQFSSYSRAHFAPVLILGHQKFSFKNRWTPDLSHLCLHSKTKQIRIRKKHSSFISKLFSLRLFTKPAIKKAERYILQNIEHDGTLSSYASATFFMIYALLAFDYHPTSPLIQNAIQGLKSLVSKVDKDYHVQNSPSTIWDTSLISYALQEAGLSIEDPVVLSSANYILSIQQNQKVEMNESRLNHVLGGWGFSESNTSNPDIDDTQAALRVISRFSLHHSEYRKAWNAGINWLLAMQNDDGGWGAFEKNKYKSLISLFPIENFKDTAIDPSTADLTGRTLEFLGNYVKMTVNHPRIKEGVCWLLENQENDGSWYGRWGVSYIYGTWAAVTGMKSVGVCSNHPSIQKAIHWLKSIQQLDGGWGESCKSDKERTFIPLSYSTVVQTSWAVDTLISTSDTPTIEIEKGIEYILNWNTYPKKVMTYPTGAGLPGLFYIHYHSYQYIWPLLTLSHYIKKYK